jgi:hypothetical protein
MLKRSVNRMGINPNDVIIAVHAALILVVLDQLGLY